MKSIFITGGAIYVDKGNPYTDQPLKVGELTITKTAQKSPLHTKGNLNCIFISNLHKHEDDLKLIVFNKTLNRHGYA